MLFASSSRHLLISAKGSPHHGTGSVPDPRGVFHSNDRAGLTMAEKSPVKRRPQDEENPEHGQSSVSKKPKVEETQESLDPGKKQ